MLIRKSNINNAQISGKETMAGVMIPSAVPTGVESVLASPGVKALIVVPEDGTKAAIMYVRVLEEEGE